MNWIFDALFIKAFFFLMIATDKASFHLPIQNL